MFKRKEALGYALKKDKKTSLFFGLGRLFTFLLVVLFIFLSIYISPYFIFGVVLMILGFLLLAHFHNIVLLRISLTDFKVGAINSYLSRMDDSWKSLGDKGDSFLDKEVFYESDLDLFGEASLYQYICNARTPFGRLTLAKSLKNPKLEDLKERQASSIELEDIDKAITIESYSRMYSKTSERNTSTMALKKMMERLEEKVTYQKAYLVIAIGCPLFLIISTILAFVSVFDYRIPVLTLLFNFGSVYLVGRGNRETEHKLFEVNQTIRSYQSFLGVKELSFESQNLLMIQKKMIQYQKGVESFMHRATLFDMRNNVLFLLFGNGIFQLDFWCRFSFSKWQEKYQFDLLDWLKTIGELENLNSLAMIGRCKRNACLPSESKTLSFRNLVHPLIMEEKGVGNDFELDGLDILTGSNMSGKTTFMRTIGVNYLLARAGSKVNGEQFSSPYFVLFTSMRATDNVSNGISTFYAEILRIKEMLCYNGEESMLVLVDEIFKGTNTFDRLQGAKGAISRLNEKKAFGLIATHDNELTEWGKENYHFEEHYEKDEILFDYKVKKGVAITTNARHLMRLAGILRGEDDEL